MSNSPSERLKEGIEWVVLFRLRLRSRQQGRAKRRARLSAMETVRRTLRGASQLNAANVKTVFNAGMYIVLLDDDIAYFTEDLISAAGGRRRAFLAKQEAALIYEAAEDLPQLLGRDFREAARALGSTDAQISRLNSASSDVNRFWQERRDFLGTIRNALAAHREHDALQYLDSLEALNSLEVMQAAADLSQLLQRLISIVTELAALATTPSAILKDMIRSTEQKSK
jgi:hypothetical protein